MAPKTAPAAGGMIQPKHVLIAFTVITLVYSALCGLNRNSCQQFWAKDCTTEERWMMDWFSVNMLCVGFFMGFWTKVTMGDASAQRRLLLHATMMMCLGMGGIVFTGSVNAGGLMVHSEFVQGLVLHFVLLNLAGAALRGGNGAMSAPLRDPMAIGRNSSLVEWHLLYSMVTIVMWFFDVAAINGIGFYMKDTSKLTPQFHEKKAWFLLTFMNMLILTAYGMVYGKVADNLNSVKLSVAWQVVYEIVARFGVAPLMTDNAVMQGSVVRGISVVLGVAAIYKAGKSKRR